MTQLLDHGVVVSDMTKYIMIELRTSCNLPSFHNNRSRYGSKDILNCNDTLTCVYRLGHFIKVSANWDSNC